MGRGWDAGGTRMGRGWDADWVRIVRGLWIAHGLYTDGTRMERGLDADWKKGTYLLTKNGPVEFVPKITMGSMVGGQAEPFQCLTKCQIVK